jgi:hypothetical protein
MPALQHAPAKLIMNGIWTKYTISPDESHHVIDGQPAYKAQFQKVLKFHEPGLAPVYDTSGAYHINSTGKPAYKERYIRNFGFYQGRAAVLSKDGWFHITANGRPLYGDRYSWCGNFQDGLCTVRHNDGLYSHINLYGATIYPEKYKYAGDYHDGSAVVQRNDGLHTHIDEAGQMLHSKWFKDADVYHKGYARVRDDSGWHHMDMSGNPLYGRRFLSVETFYNGQARVADIDGTLLVIDESGKTLVILHQASVDKFTQVSSDMVGFWRTQVIKAAVDLGTFEALPGKASEIEQALDLASNAGLRLLRALGELELVSKLEDGTWMVTEKGSVLVSSSEPSLAAASDLWGTEQYIAWMDLAQALRTGQPSFPNRYGEQYFSWVGNTEEKLNKYHTALTAYARHDYGKIPQLLDLPSNAGIIDAGGGYGDLLFSILRAKSTLAGYLLDRTEVINGTTIPQELDKRCQLIAGDIFSPWAVSADIVLLTRVLHDWPDDKAVEILKRAHDALDTNGHLYVIEMVLDEQGYLGGMLDLNMMVITGGRERYLKQWEYFFKEAGFTLVSNKVISPVVNILGCKKAN